MAIRVPLLLATLRAVVHRLDPAATRAFDPPGAPTAGYSDDFGEPIAYDVGAVRTDARQEMTAVRVPCQVEAQTEDRLRMALGGQLPASREVLVFHRRDLQRLGLIDATTREPLIRVNDRVSALERRDGAVVRRLGPGDAGLFVFEVRPASYGFGPDGHDLELIYLHDRERGVT